jgi:hypothetical protein
MCHGRPLVAQKATRLGEEEKKTVAREEGREPPASPSARDRRGGVGYSVTVGRRMQMN